MSLASRLGRRRRVLPLFLFLTAVALCWPRLRPLPATAFALPITPVSGASAVIEAPHAELLPVAGASAHAATLTQRGDGKIAAAWFSGSREGASDVAIYSSVYADGAWSAPQRIVDRQRVEQDTRRLIRKLGNPVLWRNPANNVLHLWFVSVSYGGWAGSAINHMASDDDGQHWGKVRRIVTTPFFNLSTLVRSPPLPLANGGIALPVYHEFINKRPAWLRFDRNGAISDLVRIPHGAGNLQPAAVALDSHRALILTRNSGPLHRLHIARSGNAGRDWQAAQPTPLPNPDSSIALLRMRDGSLLLACNLLEANRNQLALLRSRDEGQRWSLPLLVEQGGDNDEYSYPALLQDNAGTVHLAYTWKRQGIKHVALTPAQLELTP